MSISSINGVPTSSLSFWIGVSFPTLRGWNGDIVTPTPVPPTPSVMFVTSSLLAYWDPNDAGSRGLYPFEAGVSCSFNLAHNYTSSVHTQNGSGSLYLGGTIFRNFTSGSVNLTTYYFDGVNDFAALRPIANPAWSGDPNVINTLTTLSYEMWLRSSGSWIQNGNWISAAGNGGVRVRANNTSGQIWVYVPNVATAVTPGGTLSTNVWNHLVITLQNVNGTNDRLTGYVNGIQVFQDTTGNYVPNYPLAEFMLGTFFFSSEFQRMYVGEVRRYNKELTSTEVLQNFSSSAARYGRL
jgi:hypothetical protein